MEQIQIIKSGELNYANIFGGTGPLVYPGGHVWIYQFLDWLTDGTCSIDVGQKFFGYLYVGTLMVVLMIYSNMRVPPWCVVMLVLSKRLHSIYVLRLFNDCFTTFFMVLTIWMLQIASRNKSCNPKQSFHLTNFVTPVLFGFAISIKMNALLYFPGFLIINYFLNDEILLRTLLSVGMIVLTQVIVGWRFLFNGALIRSSYLSGAFDLKRRFLYQWTVNWKFLSQEIFNSKQFHQLLLLSHVLLLVLFTLTKWCGWKNTNKSFLQLIKDAVLVWKPTISSNNVINDPVRSQIFIVEVLASCNLIGVICARSLHYQFLSWYAWSYPFLILKNNLPIFVSVPVYLIHEWCWNVYPSTFHSSLALFMVNLFVLTGYYFNK